jgi:dipeptidyl aminopeptidase/acylaminoacyl peptidase
MSVRHAILGLGLAVSVVAARGQQAPPATEVYLAARVATAPAAGAGIGAWTNISNNAGYDNQPSFLPDGSAVLFSSSRDGKQTDIYRYDLGSRQVSQVTRTPESEYSPAVTPDGRTFSAVRVEADGTQRLWRFDLDGSNPRVVLEHVKPVGYHAWIDGTRLALFVLGANNAPATLQLADTTTGAASIAVTGIGRSLLVRPKTGTVSYLATGETPRMLKEIDPRTGAIAPIVAPPQGSQDAAWAPDGLLLMAAGTTIYAWRPGAAGWSEYATLDDAAGRGAAPAPPAVGSITRLAVSPDGRWLSFVAEPRVQ